MVETIHEALFVPRLAKPGTGGRATQVGVQDLGRQCRRYWRSEHLYGFKPTTPSSGGGMPIHYTDKGPY